MQQINNPARAASPRAPAVVNNVNHGEEYEELPAPHEQEADDPLYIEALSNDELEQLY